MSDFVLNLVSEPSQRAKSGECNGNAKHARFLKKRRYLEQKGFLKDKQNKKKNLKRGKKRRQRRVHEEGKTKPGAVFTKFTTSLPGTNEPSSSMMLPCRKFSAKLSSTACTSQGKTAQKVVPRPCGPLKYIALDCEMVGTGPKGSISELGRCSIVSYDGDVIYDKFVQPTTPVTDFRTPWSGIRRQDLCNATPFRQAQKEILEIMTGKVVVGHAIKNDFKAIRYFHPASQTRDTARIPLLNKKAGLPERQVASLKRLTKALFNKDIQTGRRGHSSVEDAKATMELYKVVEEEWEQKLASQTVSLTEFTSKNNAVTD